MEHVSNLLNSVLHLGFTVLSYYLSVSYDYSLLKDDQKKQR